MATLSAFNPHEMSEATVRKVATGREDALADILATIRGNIGAATMQHLILSAPRGYGKSFLMRHVEIEAERIAREEKLPLVALLMPEEMPHVKWPETLIHELTRALTGGATAEAKLAWHEDEDSAFEDAARALSAAIRDRLGQSGLCVALIENFDRLLPRAFPRERQRLRLRGMLTEQGGQFMVIAASASGAFDRDYDHEFYQAFREVALAPWSFDECLAFFARQREAAGKPPLDAREHARAKAIAIFIGGTPRLATMLGEILLGEDVLGAADLLRKLVDELTPYYKERIEALPGRSQILLDALLRRGEPATQSELARRVGANGQGAIAGPFHDLVRERIIVGVKASGSAEVLYRVADRVFAHYYRLRVIEHGKALCPLEALVDLLAAFFSPEEKGEKAGEFARLGRFDEARVMARLWDSERGETREQRYYLLYDLEFRYVPLSLAPLVDAALTARLVGIARTAREGHIHEARKQIEDLLRTRSPAGDHVALLLFRSMLDAYEGFGGGLASSDEAVTIAADLPQPEYLAEAKLHRVWSLFFVGRDQEVLKEAERVAERARARGDVVSESRAYRYVSWSLARLSRFDNAIDAAARAAWLSRTANDLIGEATARRCVAEYLALLSRHMEALDAAERAAGLAVAAGDRQEEAMALRLRALVLERLSRHAEAVDAAGRAAECARGFGDDHEEAKSLAILAHCENAISHFAEALKAAELAIDAARRVGAKAIEASCQFVAGFALMIQGQDAIAAPRFLEAAATFEITNEWGWRSRSYRFAARSFANDGRAFEAVGSLARAARVLEAHQVESEEKSLVLEAEVCGELAASLSPDLAVDEAASNFHGWLSAAAVQLDFAGIGVLTLQSWLNGCVDATLRGETRPDILETLATAIVIHFPDRFASERRRLTDAAHYHRSARERAALERIDPDFARVLATMHPPRDDNPTITLRGSTKKFKSRAKKASADY